MPRLPDDSVKAVTDLLVDLFSDHEEFRREVQLHWIQNPSHLYASIGGSSNAARFSSLVDQFDRRGLIGEDFFSELENARRGRAIDIQRVRDRVRQSRTDAARASLGDGIGSSLPRAAEDWADISGCETTLGILGDLPQTLNATEDEPLRALIGAIAHLAQSHDRRIRRVLVMQGALDTGWWQRVRSGNAFVGPNRQALSVNELERLGLHPSMVILRVEDNQQAFLDGCGVIVSLGGTKGMIGLWRRARTRPFWRPWIGLPFVGGYSAEILCELDRSIYGPTVRALASWQVQSLKDGPWTVGGLTATLRAAFLASRPTRTVFGDILDLVRDIRRDDSVQRIAFVGFVLAASPAALGIVWLSQVAQMRAEADAERSSSRNIWFADKEVLDAAMKTALEQDVSFPVGERSELLELLTNLPALETPPRAKRASQWNVPATKAGNGSLKLVEYWWDLPKGTFELSVGSVSNADDGPSTVCAWALPGEVGAATTYELARPASVPNHANGVRANEEKFTINPPTHGGASPLLQTEFSVVCGTIFARMTPTLVDKVGSNPYNLAEGTFQWFVGRWGTVAGKASPFIPVYDDPEQPPSEKRLRLPPPYVHSAVRATFTPHSTFDKALTVLVGGLCGTDSTDSRVLSVQTGLAAVLSGEGGQNFCQTATAKLKSPALWFIPETALAQQPNLWYIFLSAP